MIDLYQGDCLTIMNELIDQGITVDMILTDPPYLTSYKTNYRKNKSHDFCSVIENDNNFELIREFIKLSHALLKDNSHCYCFCNASHVDFFKEEIEKCFKIKNILIWIKNNWTAGDLKGAYAKQTEFIIYATKGRKLLNGRRDSDCLFYDRISGNNQLHQNQKPTDLLEFIINKSSNSDDMILDPFMGSGSTGVACRNTNRNFIGIELDKKYFATAKERINGVQNQKRLI